MNQEGLEGREAALHALLREMGSVAVAFSGGADSALVVAVAGEALGERAVAVTGISASLAPDDLVEAEALCGRLGVPLVRLATQELEDPRYVRNAPDRCYFCKSELYGRVRAWAEANGVVHVADGLNADDDPGDRPGVRAGVERGVRSPLREAGLTKADVRELSRRRGLPTADKPASPCLASRLPHGTPVTPARLERVGRAERALRRLGFHELRVRDHGDLGRLCVPPPDFDRALAQREVVAAALREAGYRRCAIDLYGLPGAPVVVESSAGASL